MISVFLFFCQSQCVRKQDIQDSQDVQDKRYLFAEESHNVLIFFFSCL